MSTEAFVDQLYRQFLYREADEAGKADWINRLENEDWTVIQATELFLKSEEFVGRAQAVSELYYRSFGRIPDQDGMQYWLDQLDTGKTLDDLNNGFVNSQEYQQLWGDTVSNEQFVDTSYRIFHNSPGDTGQVTQLDNGHITRANLLETLAVVTNSRTKVPQIATYYGILNRLPTDEELAAAPADLSDLITQLYKATDYSGVTPPTKVAAASTSVNEDAGQVTITLTRTGDTSKVSEITYVTEDGKAKAGSDFTAASGTVTFAKDELTRQITVDITDDTEPEARENFKLKLTAQDQTLVPQATDIWINQSDPLERTDIASLIDKHGVILQGTQSGDRTGMSVSGAGDVNGDGFADLLIASSGAHGGIRDTYLVFGKQDGWDKSVDLSALDGTTGVRLQGPGSKVSSAGDVNGDGIADILIGGHTADPDDKTNAGESYLIFGHKGSWDASMDTRQLDGSNGVVIKGAAEGDASGYAISAAGDIDGDGFGDLIIGAPHAQPDANAANRYQGEGYLLYGKADNWSPTLELSSLSAADGFKITNTDFRQLGIAVSGAGDVNGDGFADFLISNFIDPVDDASLNLYDYWGQIKTYKDSRSFLVFGSEQRVTGELDLSTLNGSNGVAFVMAEGFITNSVAAAGDVNGDGFGDILLGMPFSKKSESGTFLIYGHGRNWNSTIDTEALNGTDGSWLKGDYYSGDSAGQSVTGIGDVNKDGIDDLMIGSRNPDVRTALSSPAKGAADIIFGAPGTWGAQVDLFETSAGDGLPIKGSANGDDLGMSLSGAGDVNGDGYVDFILGAPGVDSDGKTNAGEAYLLFGSDTLFV